ncbi:MAG: hypothetical protein ABI473_11175 [Candidatus Dormibacter sp.]
MEAFPGRYAIEGTPLCRVSPPPEDREGFDAQARTTIGIGRTRTGLDAPGTERHHIPYVLDGLDTVAHESR